MAQENFVTTSPQIAEDRTTNNRKAKEHALKNTEKWTEPSSGEKKIRTEPIKARAGWKTAGKKKHTKIPAHKRDRSPTTP